MKRFEAIEEEIQRLEAHKKYINISEYGYNLLSELKQITDEHSEMVKLLNVCSILLKERHLYETAKSIQDYLTKINDKEL